MAVLNVQFFQQMLANGLTILGSFLVAMISSNGFWNHIEKKGGLKEQVAKLWKAFQDFKDEVNAKEEKKAAEDARRRILRFNDELLNGVRHSQEYFNEILNDVDTYEKYCEDHPKFPNSRTVFAVQNIRDCYAKCLKEHDFAENSPKKAIQG